MVPRSKQSAANFETKVHTMRALRTLAPIQLQNRHLPLVKTNPYPENFIPAAPGAHGMTSPTGNYKSSASRNRMTIWQNNHNEINATSIAKNPVDRAFSPMILNERFTVRNKGKYVSDERKPKNTGIIREENPGGNSPLPVYLKRFPDSITKNKHPRAKITKLIHANCHFDNSEK